jgi:hypothetical protein
MGRKQSMDGDANPTSDLHAQELKVCDDCGGLREHETSILLRAETKREDVRSANETYSRCPYRVFTCMYCGEKSREQVG